MKRLFRRFDKKRFDSDQEVEMYDEPKFINGVKVLGELKFSEEKQTAREMLKTIEEYRKAENDFIAELDKKYNNIVSNTKRKELITLYHDLAKLFYLIHRRGDMMCQRNELLGKIKTKNKQCTKES